MTEKRKVGRPTTYDEKLADLICALVQEGKTQIEICSLDYMPARSTLYEWIKNNEEFSVKYKEAEKASADAMMDKAYHNLSTIDVEGIWIDEKGKQYSEDELKDFPEQDRKKFGLKNVGLSSTLVQLRKEQFNASKQFAAIRNREKYADAKKLEHTGKLDVKSFLAEVNNESED